VPFTYTLKCFAALRKCGETCIIWQSVKHLIIDNPVQAQCAPRSEQKTLLRCPRFRRMVPAVCPRVAEAADSESLTLRPVCKLATPRDDRDIHLTPTNHSSISPELLSSPNGRNGFQIQSGRGISRSQKHRHAGRPEGLAGLNAAVTNGILVVNQRGWCVAGGRRGAGMRPSGPLGLTQRRIHTPNCQASKPHPRAHSGTPQARVAQVVTRLLFVERAFAADRALELQSFRGSAVLHQVSA